MRIALITNAASGSGEGPSANTIAAELRGGGATVSVHDVCEPKGAGAQRADRIAVAGGDGSIGVAAEVAAGAGVPLAVIPTGTANDFARALELPDDLEEACALAADPGAELRRVDLAHAGEVPFLNAASAGLSVLAARRAAPLKSRLGPLAYAVGAIRAGLTARPMGCRVTCDGAEAFAGSTWQVTVAGTGAFGGGSEIDVADEDDTLLDVAVLEAGARIALVRRAWGLRTGGITEQEPVLHARGRTIEVHAPAGTRFNIDGELRDIGHPARFRTGEHHVMIVAPSAASSASPRV